MGVRQRGAQGGVSVGGYWRIVGDSFRSRVGGVCDVRGWREGEIIGEYLIYCREGWGLRVEGSI